MLSTRRLTLSILGMRALSSVSCEITFFSVQPGVTLEGQLLIGEIGLVFAELGLGIAEPASA